jgi:proliferating cell nuclear antigen
MSPLNHILGTETPVQDDSRIAALDLDTGLFRSITLALNAIAQECVVTLDPAGLGIRVLDPANVAMVSVEVKRPVRIEGLVQFGFDALKVKEAFFRGSEADLNPQNPIRIKVWSRRDARYLVVSAQDATYELKEIPLANLRRVPNRPDLDLPGQSWVSSEQLFRALVHAGRLSDRVTLTLERGVLTVTAKGDGHVLRRQIPVSIGSTENEGKTYTAKYSLDYLGEICKATRGAGLVGLHFFTDRLLVLTANPAEHCTIEFILAPRTGEDD